MKYWYFVWEATTDRGLPVGGCAVDYHPSYFDLASVHSSLRRQHKVHCIVTKWTEICEAQYKTFSDYCLKQALGGQTPAKVLTLVPGEKRD